MERFGVFDPYEVGYVETGSGTGSVLLMRMGISREERRCRKGWALHGPR